MRFLILAELMWGLLSIAAPVPKHLMPPAPDPIQPGFVWWFGGDQYLVLWTDGQVVGYTCTTRPDLVHGGLDGCWCPNHQSRARTVREFLMSSGPPCPNPENGP